MPLPQPKDDKPITAGEWGLLTLAVVGALHGLAVTFLT